VKRKQKKTTYIQIEREREKKKNYQIYRSIDGRVEKKISENFGYFWNFLEN
jgi:hypothetical protein